MTSPPLDLSAALTPGHTLGLVIILNSSTLKPGFLFSDLNLIPSREHTHQPHPPANPSITPLSQLLRGLSPPHHQMPSLTESFPVIFAIINLIQPESVFPSFPSHQVPLLSMSPFFPTTPPPTHSNQLLLSALPPGTHLPSPPMASTLMKLVDLFLSHPSWLLQSLTLPPCNSLSLCLWDNTLSWFSHDPLCLSRVHF